MMKSRRMKTAIAAVAAALLLTFSAVCATGCGQSEKDADGGVEVTSTAGVPVTTVCKQFGSKTGVEHNVCASYNTLSFDMEEYAGWTWTAKIDDVNVTVSDDFMDMNAMDAALLSDSTSENSDDPEMIGMSMPNIRHIGLSIEKAGDYSVTLTCTKTGETKDSEDHSEEYIVNFMVNDDVYVVKAVGKDKSSAEVFRIITLTDGDGNLLANLEKTGKNSTR